MIKIVKKITMIAVMTAVMLTTTITPTSSTTTVFAASGYSGKIYKHWCRMRKSKSKKAKTIKKLKIGTKVTVLSTSGSWRKIKVGGKTE